MISSATSASRPTGRSGRSGRCFNIQLFHVGFLYEQPVQINLVNGGVCLPRSPFRQRPVRLPRQERLQESRCRQTWVCGVPDPRPAPQARVLRRVDLFLGASYFRVLGRDQAYGLSARGLAIDTAASRGENFPGFREFWGRGAGAEAPA